MVPPATAPIITPLLKDFFDSVDAKPCEEGRGEREIGHNRIKLTLWQLSFLEMHQNKTAHMKNYFLLKPWNSKLPPKFPYGSAKK
jgi:hypothetical protein